MIEIVLTVIAVGAAFKILSFLWWMLLDLVRCLFAVGNPAAAERRRIYAGILLHAYPLYQGVATGNGWEVLITLISGAIFAFCDYRALSTSP